MNKPTLIFDLDGTLVDTAPDLVTATNHALKHLDLGPVPADEIRPYVSFGARGMINHALKISKVNADDVVREKLLNDFLDYYTENIDRESRAYPGVEELLENCKRNGAHLGVCTNKREALSRRLLQALGLDQYFDAVTGSDTLPIHKPDPGHLIATVILARGNLDRAIMIGDSKTDLDTARAAGMPFIGVSFGYSDIDMSELEPDVLIDHYSEFNAALEKISELRKAMGADY